MLMAAKQTISTIFLCHYPICRPVQFLSILNINAFDLLRFFPKQRNEESWQISTLFKFLVYLKLEHHMAFFLVDK